MLYIQANQDIAWISSNISLIDLSIFLLKVEVIL